MVNRGPHKAAVDLRRGPQVDLMTLPPGATGSYLVHFTGSNAHNVRLRGMPANGGGACRRRGSCRLDIDGQALTGTTAELRTFATEEEVYRFLGLP